MGDIPISQLPSDLVYNGNLDVSNGVKQAKYDSLNSAYKSSNGGGGVSKPAAPDSSAIDSFSSDPNNSLTSYITNNINPMQDKAYNDYLMAARAQQTPSQMYDTMENAAGLPQLRTTANTLQGQVNSLGDTINNIEPTVNANTTNSLVTEGQRTGMVTAQKYPLQQILTPLSSKLSGLESSISNQEQGINTRVGYGVQSNAQTLDPYKQNMQNMATRAAQLITGFTADKSNQLQVLLARYNAGAQLSRDEIQQAADLTKIEKQYALESQNQLALQNDKLTKVSKGGYVIDNQGNLVSTPPTGTGATGGGGNVLTAPTAPSYTPTPSQTTGGFDWSTFGL